MTKDTAAPGATGVSRGTGSTEPTRWPGAARSPPPTEPLRTPWWPPPPLSPPPPGYATRRGTDLRPGSPARDLASFHVRREDRLRLHSAQAYLAREGRIPPLWEVLQRILDTSPLVLAALAADERERAFEAWRRGEEPPADAS